MDRMKRSKKMALKKVGGKRGFTLIELLIVMVIIAILIGGIIYALGGFTRPAEATAYDTQKQSIGTSVQGYWVERGSYPTHSCTVEGTTTVDVIDLCLLVTDGYFDDVPSSAVLVITAAWTDNCGGSNTNCTCHADGHYLWYWDAANTTIRTFCDLNSNNAWDAADIAGGDGYQAGLWP